MMSTFRIFEELSQAMDPAAARKLAGILDGFYTELQQQVTKSDFNELKAVVRDLGEAQKATERRLDTLTQRVEELAHAQKRTEQTMEAGFKDLHLRFGVLGSRWGDRAEEAFRQGLLEVVRGLGYTVEHHQGQDPESFINRRPRSYDLDVLVRDGELVVAEIKSNASGPDVTEFHRSVLLFEEQTKRKVTKRILVAVTIQQGAQERAS
ncbi:MAG: DUF3782 domain-containing protein, partial [Verrucomicrobia bacterium]|nr:DUF3782 domain-containing protein [Verrucomicrobiota bacterium]